MIRDFSPIAVTCIAIRDAILNKMFPAFVYGHNIIPTYVGTGVSCTALCLAVTSPVVGCVRLSLIQLNFSIWALASTAGVVSAI